MSSNIMLIGFAVLAVGMTAYAFGFLRNRPAAMAFALGSAILALGLAIYTGTRDAPNGPRANCWTRPTAPRPRRATKRPANEGGKPPALFV